MKSRPYALDYTRYALPFRTPVKTSRGTYAVREGIRLTLSDAQGICGLGEIAPWEGFACETLDDAEFALKQLGKQLSKTAAFDALTASGTHLPCTRQALAAALFQAETPSSRYLPEPPDARIARLIPRNSSSTPESIFEQIEQARILGFRVFKVKIGLRPLSDEIQFCGQLLRLVAERTPELRIRFDANGIWNDPAVLNAFVPLCAFRQLEFFEQVLRSSPENDACIFALPTMVAEKMALDESLREPWEMPTGTPVIAVIKPLLIGDFQRLRRWLQARDIRSRFVLSSVFETEFGRSTLRFLCSENANNPRALAFGIGTRDALVEV